jgi:DNA-binding NarL/FixJ family response regulator
MLAITSSRSPRNYNSRQDLERRAPQPAVSKILVVDDHFLMREGLCELIKVLNSEAVIVEAQSGRDAIELMSEQPDIGLVLLDANLPDHNGLAVLGELRSRHPAASVVVLLDQHDRDIAVKALDLGAQGIIAKTEPRQIIQSAVALVLAGGVYIPHEVLVPETPPTRTVDLNLTDRQRDILALMMQGKPNKTICRTLNLAMPTVKNHITAILRALKVTNRTEAVISVLRSGWELPPAT